MSTSLPNFNVTYDWWLPGNPTTNPPDITGDYCQPYYWTKLPDHIPVGVYMEIRLDKSWWNNINMPVIDSIFLIRDFYGNKWWYLVQFWDYVHRNFPNEYIMILAKQCNSDGTTPPTTR